MMKGLNFQYKIFRKQDLSNWFLVGADLRGTILEEANLSFADLTGAILYYANLRGTNLYGATYDKNTVFPDGFDPVAVGMNKVDTLF